MTPVVVDVARGAVEFLRLTSILGFIICTIILLNISSKAFRRVFVKRTAIVWFLYFIFLMVPAMLFLYVFSLLFGRG